jgi:hypothetical protein
MLSFLVAEIRSMKKYCDHENILSTDPEEFTLFQRSRMLKIASQNVNCVRVFQHVRQYACAPY